MRKELSCPVFDPGNAVNVPFEDGHRLIVFDHGQPFAENPPAGDVETVGEHPIAEQETKLERTRLFERFPVEAEGLDQQWPLIAGHDQLLRHPHGLD